MMRVRIAFVNAYMHYFAQNFFFAPGVTVFGGEVQLPEGSGLRYYDFLDISVMML